MRFLLCFALSFMVGCGVAQAQAVRFGVVTKFEQGLNNIPAIDLIRQAGVSVNRDVVNWQRVERVRDAYFWTTKNTAVYAALKDKGIATDVVLTTRNPRYDGGEFPTSPAAVAGFARFAAYVATKLRGQTVAFEIGNEFRPSPKVRSPDYVTLFVAAANAIHAADPDARVVADPAILASLTPGTIPPVGTLVGDTVRRALAVADGVVVHQYPHQQRGVTVAQAQTVMVAAMTKRAAWLETLAGRPMPLYVTEYGWPRIVSRGIDAEEQARQIAITTTALAAMPFVRVAILYELADSCTSPLNTECSFGLYARRSRTLVPKPALKAFRDAVAAAAP